METAQKVILIVDDDQNFLDIMKAKLEAAGYAVFTAADGPQGLAQIKTIRPDLVLLDIQMPKMDGTKAIVEIHRNPETAKTKVFFLSNVGERFADVPGMNDKVALGLGALGYINKSDDLADVLERIRKALAS